MTRRNRTQQDTARRGSLTALLIAVLAAGCGGGGGGDGTPPATVDDPPVADTAFPDIVDRTVFVNPDDSFLYQLGLRDGSNLSYLGQRDDAGLPTALTDIAFTDAEGAAFDVSLNSLGLPVRIADEQGNVLALEFLDTTGQPVGALPTALDPLGAAGKARASTVSVLPQMEESVAASVPTIRVRIWSPADDGSGRLVELADEISLEDPVRVLRGVDLVQDRASSPEGNVVVEVEKCDVPIDPAGAVTVDFRRTNSSLSGRYPAWPAGPGQTGKFIARLPTRPASSDLLQTADAICSAAADSLDKVCKVFNPVASSPAIADSLQNPGVQAAFCAQLTQAVALSPLAAKAPVIGGLCVGGLAATTAACSSLGFSAANPDSSNLLAGMCGVFDEVERGLQALDAAEGLDIAQLQAIVDFRGGAGIAQPGTAPAGLVASAPEEADAAGPFPVLRVNDLRPSVDQLRVAPRQPEAGMPYTAEADLSCVQGADITISAERDGQTIAGDFLSSTSDRATISLEVPAGPDEGGVDIVRVAASNPALAQSAQRTLAVDIDRNEEPSAPPPGETPVFNEVREAAFSVSLSAEMERFEPEEGVVIREVRPVNVAAAMLLPQAAFDCFAFDFASRSPDPSMPVPNQFGFLFRGDQVDGGSPATRVVSFVSGLIPSDPPDAACQQLDQLNLSRREEQADDFSIQGEDFFTTLQGVPLEGLVGGGSFNEAQSVRFELMGQAVCDAIKDFEFESADGVFRASGGDTTRCDSASRLEVIFSR